MLPALIIQSVTLIVLLVLFVFFIVQYFNMIFRGYAPFLSTRGAIVGKIIDQLQLEPGETAYELGCGNAPILRALRKRFPQLRLIGIEYSFLPYLIAKFQSVLTGTKLEFRKENFMKTDLTQADAVYCYLNDETMRQLGPKFKRELKPGAVVASYRFRIDGAPSETVIASERPNEHIYIYHY